jgi:NADPH-dependent 2,4-dienoyl-CoA reductase/sulfur reductase-like enzyme
VAVGGFFCDAGRLATLSVDGQTAPVGLLLLGIGAEPEHQLASDAGLHCDNGIVVDECMRTSDAAILAIGDCCNFPQATSGRRLRIESVQNANDQARTALATLANREEPYRALPWFWSEQGALRLQMAGLLPADGCIFGAPVRLKAASRCCTISAIGSSAWSRSTRRSITSWHANFSKPAGTRHPEKPATRCLR